MCVFLRFQITFIDAHSTDQKLSAERRMKDVSRQKNCAVSTRECYLKLSPGEFLKTLLGEQKAADLERAIARKQPIIISGVNISGKTTLATILRKHGCTVIEDFEAYHIVLDKPLDEIVLDKSSEIF